MFKPQGLVGMAVQAKRDNSSTIAVTDVSEAFVRALEALRAERREEVYAGLENLAAAAVPPEEAAKNQAFSGLVAPSPPLPEKPRPAPTSTAGPSRRNVLPWIIGGVAALVVVGCIGPVVVVLLRFFFVGLPSMRAASSNKSFPASRR
jgi:hypothetical protein